jgi:hypothetical protein
MAVNRTPFARPNVAFFGDRCRGFTRIPKLRLTSLWAFGTITKLAYMYHPFMLTIFAEFVAGAVIIGDHGLSRELMIF